MDSFLDDEDESSNRLADSFNNLEDDYYTTLNVPRDASDEEITFQYRKLSRIYHPDKHTDLQNKADADILFSKIKTAYETLLDPVKRAIYDNTGIKGLETEGMELVTKFKTPQEIREEYEKIAKAKELKRLEQKTNPKGSVTVSVNATELFYPYSAEDDEEDEDYYTPGAPLIEITGFQISQSIETPLSRENTFIMSGNVNTENGRGTGSINGGFRKLLTPSTWAEAELGGTPNGLKFGLKGFSQLSSRYYSTIAANCQTKNGLIKPSLVVELGSQLDEKSIGNLSWRSSVVSHSLTASYAKETLKTRTSLAVVLGIPASLVSVNFVYKKKSETNNDEERYKASFKVGTFGATLEYGIDKKLSHFSTYGAAVVVGVPDGIYLRLKVLRGSQTYYFPIHLCDEIVPSAVVYGTLLPLAFWLVTKKLVVEPYLKEKEKNEKEKTKRLYKEKMEQKREEAASAVNLMTETYKRIVADETEKKGLVIVKALYGTLFDQVESRLRDEVIDVTIPLQCLSKDSKLILHEGKKSQLPGFYDPSPAEEKSLYVRYKFKNALHETIANEVDRIKIPLKDHLIPQS